MEKQTVPELSVNTWFPPSTEIILNVALAPFGLQTIFI